MINKTIDERGRINFTYSFGFEENFEYKDKIGWMQNNWKSAYYVIFAYLCIIFLGQRWMLRRERYELRRSLIAWNAGLAIFSLIGTCRTLPEVVHVWRTYGFQYTVCSRSYNHANPVISFWVWLFILSKVSELFDTVFIVLRKQKLLVLHWYHHVTVLLYTWYSYQQEISVARWFIAMNYPVHAFMYSYYALRAMKVPIPKFVAMFITTAQLLQMVVGLYVNLWGYGALVRGEKCGTNYWNINASLIMYASYCVLFANFFYNSYVKRRSDGKKML